MNTLLPQSSRNSKLSKCKSWISCCRIDVCLLALAWWSGPWPWRPGRCLWRWCGPPRRRGRGRRGRASARRTPSPGPGSARGARSRRSAEREREEEDLNLMWETVGSHTSLEISIWLLSSLFVTGDPRV